MLTYISIKNYLTVNSLELNFKNGMTAITGETGSGKSVLIGALNATLGQPVSSDLISKGADKLEITSIFNIKNLPNVQEYLKEFEFYDGDELILRRIVSIDGKNKCFINSNVCKVSDLKKMSEYLLTFHDQNQQQNLVKNKRQLALLDSFANNDSLYFEVKQLYNSIKKEKDKLFNLKNNFDESNALYQLLTYQVNEIEELDLKPNEYAELELEYNKLAKASDYITEVNSAYSILDNDSEFDVITMLSQLKKHIEKIEDKSKLYNEITETVESAYINLKEAKNMLISYSDTFEVNPERLQEVSDRIDLILSIAKKHQTTPDRIPLLFKELKERLEKIDYSELNLEALELKIQNLNEQYLIKAKELRDSRIETIPVLEEAINNELSKLNFNKNIFSIVHSKNYPDYAFDEEYQFMEHGIDKIDFYIQPNIGQDKQLLSKAASGGELSRISLVLELLSSQKKSVPTLIFDEVDSGIGGETGDSVGNLLKDIGNNNQLLVITHLPQVAAKSANHIIVKKGIKADNTLTIIEEVADNEKVNEIARMLGGTRQISNETWNYAKKLIEGNN